MKRTTKAVIIYLVFTILLAFCAVYLIVSRLLAMEVMNNLTL